MTFGDTNLIAGVNAWSVTEKLQEFLERSNVHEVSLNAGCVVYHKLISTPSQTTGQLESMELLPSSSNEAPCYVVSFRSRNAAEQGLAKGSNIPIELRGGRIAVSEDAR